MKKKKDIHLLCTVVSVLHSVVFSRDCMFLTSVQT